MLSAIDRNHCPQSIGTPVRNRRNPQIAVGLDKTRGKLVGECWYRPIADEMPHQLVGDVPGGCRMTREHRECSAALLQISLIHPGANQRLSARLMHARIERELASMLLPRRHDCPARDDFRKSGDVV